MQKGEAEKTDADHGRPITKAHHRSSISLESLYSLNSRQSSSSKHLWAQTQVHPSHHNLMNYAILVFWVSYYPSSDALICPATPAADISKTESPSHTCAAVLLNDEHFNSAALRWSLLCSVSQVESPVGQTIPVTETVWSWRMIFCAQGSFVAEPESILSMCQVHTTPSPSNSR